MKILNKEQFAKDYSEAKENFGDISKIVVAVKLPTDATELITNTEQIETKIDYYLNAYDDNMRLKTNSTIQIIGWLFV